MLLEILILRVVIIIIVVLVLRLNIGVSRPFNSVAVSRVHRLNRHCTSHLRLCPELEPFPDGRRASAQLFFVLPRLHVASRFVSIVSVFVVESEKRGPFPPALV
jgi:hypothetical protein